MSFTIVVWVSSLISVFFLAKRLSSKSVLRNSLKWRWSICFNMLLFVKHPAGSSTSVNGRRKYKDRLTLLLLFTTRWGCWANVKAPVGKPKLSTLNTEEKKSWTLRDYRTRYLSFDKVPKYVLIDVFKNKTINTNIKTL